MIKKAANELRSWVQLPPGPFLLGNYGIKLSLFYHVFIIITGHKIVTKIYYIEFLPVKSKLQN
jgi:hypothetical protein